MSLKAGRVGVRPDQVDAQGYITGSGGGGGGGTSGKYVIDELFTPASVSTSDVLTLSKAYTDYDMIVLWATFSGSGIDNVTLENHFVTYLLKTGSYIGINNDVQYLWVTITGENKLTVGSSTVPTTNFKFGVYGIKFNDTEVENNE